MSLNFCDNLTDKKTPQANKAKPGFKDESSLKMTEKKEEEVVERIEKDVKKKVKGNAQATANTRGHNATSKKKRQNEVNWVS